MKYTPELAELVKNLYESGKSPKEIADHINSQKLAKNSGDTDLGAELIPERSIIAKLSSMGVYKRKQYLTKRGEVPIKKEEYIERIAALLDVSAEMLESLEKVNKSVLSLLEKKLS